MRQSLVPWAGDAHLRGTRVARETVDRVALLGGQRCFKECGLQRKRRVAGNLALQPNLVDAPLAPIGEQTDAVGTRYNILEVRIQLRHR
jgi:hypothetical protein